MTDLLPYNSKNYAIKVIVILQIKSKEGRNTFFQHYHINRKELGFNYGQ